MNDHTLLECHHLCVALPSHACDIDIVVHTDIKCFESYFFFENYRF